MRKSIVIVTGVLVAAMTLAGGQVRERAVNMVGHERATRTALLPIRSEHEMIDNQLAAPGE
jgi:hypothetical protein